MTMLRALRRGIAWFVLIGWLAFLAGQPMSARVIGARGKLDPLLKTLEAPLQKRGIDVVAGDTANHPLGTRPRVARLSGMPTAKPPAGWKSRPWMKSFEAGRTGFLAAAPGEGRKRARSSSEFLQAWKRAPADQRVFLSFTRKDVRAAESAARALEARGYVTFIYLTSKSKGPKYDTTTVGRLYAEAGHRLVVDTPNARRSEGVWLEARLARPGGRPPPESSRERGGRHTSRSASSKPSSPHVEPWVERKFVRDIREGVVTKNPAKPDTLFVHRTMRNGRLVDLTYLIKVGKDGSWTVHEARPGRKFGRRVGKLGKALDGVSIGTCNC